MRGHFEFSEGGDLSNLWSVSDSYFLSISWGQISRGMVYLDRCILPIVWDLLNHIRSWDKWVILQYEFSGDSLSYEEGSKVHTLLIQGNEWIFADGTNFENSGKFVGSLVQLDDYGCNDDLCLVWVEAYRDFLLLLWSQDSYQDKMNVTQTLFEWKWRRKRKNLLN